jgi:hypothetical protein
MGGEIFRNGAELQRLVNIGGSPSLSNKQVGSSDIFGDTTDGNSSYVVKSSAATDVAGTSAPSSVESILDGLSHVDEEIKRLADGIRTWRIVKQLWRASHGDFAVGKQVRKTCAQPVRLGNLQESVSFPVSACTEKAKKIEGSQKKLTISASRAPTNSAEPPGRSVICSRPKFKLPALK